MLSGMVWRNIGPFRGGRVSAVSGVVGQPGVFYMGLPMGGVWKTTGAGATWFPVFDSVKEASSVGAVEVAPSDPNVIYVGTGDMIVGGGISRGNGVYKSTDAGATWKHIGLDQSEHIPSILVDPHDPNLVVVAAQGPIHSRSDARGLYRSTDGGVTWTKTLFVSDETGVQKIARAYDHPNVMLATTVRYYIPPGQTRGFLGGGQGPSETRLYRSTDEGITWKQLTGSGLPTLNGRTCVAVAQNTDARRMFLVGNFGLYRSDDSGESWRRMDASDRRVANGQGGYNCGVYVDSRNPDIVYVVNTCLYRSTDGGNTFTGFKGAPGGDDPQQLWIDPTDGKRICLGSDQGTTISLDGGLTWSSWYNQPTGQVYHISVDNRFPYWVYATQQDSGSIGTASRGNLGEITPLDWLPHPGFEFGSIVADPLNPQVSYAGGPSGGIIKATFPSGQWIDVSPNMDSHLALRKVGNQPMLFSPTNPHELLAGFQCVMATTDGGKSWRALGPDLTKRPGDPEPGAGERASGGAGDGGNGGPKSEVRSPHPKRSSGSKSGGRGRSEARSPESGSESHDSRLTTHDSAVPLEEEEDEEETQEQRFGPRNAIESIAVSSVDGRVMWAGSNNGIIQVTRDHGATWEDVTPPALPNGTRADISALDASHQEAGTAYAAVDCHGAGDYKPYLYRTRDFGKSWTLIVNGLPADQPSGSFARVIRADTRRAGLLFAGTESSVYVSFDDGDHWQPLTLNLPNTSYRDMVVKDNDVVVGTYGRGFWILDDISPLRQMSAGMAAEPAHLFKPCDAVRVRRNVNGDTPFPPEVPHASNPPDGAIIYYSLGAKPAGEITLEVRDTKGELVRRMSSAPIPPLSDPPPPVPDFWVEKRSPLPTQVGLNRANWNLRYDNPPAFSHSYEINANPGETPASPEGPLALPGVYTVTLTVDGKSYRQTVTVKNDPRSPASMADLRAQHELEMKLYHCTQEAWNLYHQVDGARSSLTALLKQNPPSEVATAAHTIDEKLAAVGGTVTPRGSFGGFPGAGGAARQPTFTSVNGSAARQLGAADSGDMAPCEPMRRACEATCADLQKALTNWQALQAKELHDFIALLTKNNLKPMEGFIAATAPATHERRKKQRPRSLPDAHRGTEEGG